MCLFVLNFDIFSIVMSFEINMIFYFSDFFMDFFFLNALKKTRAPMAQKLMLHSENCIIRQHLSNGHFQQFSLGFVTPCYVIMNISIA